MAKQRPTRAVDPAAFLSTLNPPMFTALHLPEPRLLFGGGSQECDPKTGLAVHGPFDGNQGSRKEVVRLGVIGTPQMVDLTKRWLSRCCVKVAPVKLIREGGTLKQAAADPIASPFFPGLRDVFRAEFLIPDDLVEVLPPRDVAAVQAVGLFEPRVTRLVEAIIERLRVLVERMSAPDVVIVALPTELRQLCTVPSHHKTRAKQPTTLADELRKALRKDEERGQLNLIDIAAVHSVSLDESDSRTEHSVLHHGLKARAMGLGVPIQLIWQPALEGGPSVQDDATRAWNFWTGIYYKAGGVPWRVTGLEHGTCYVGLHFYRDKRDDSLRTCMAQTFSDQGEGIVLRSEPFKWIPSEASRSPHLPFGVARNLIASVIEAYRRFHGQAPGRVVVHKWQRYESEELRGFQEATGPERAYDFVAFGSRDLRFFRTGQEPPLRGTMVNLPGDHVLLYTRGYVPYLGQYPGMRIPRPIEIVEHHGTSQSTKVCQEILALTKMDWNSTAFGAKEPITTAFAEDVGCILAELPPEATVRPQYRFYM